MGAINQGVTGEKYKVTVLHFFCRIWSTDGGKEKIIREEVGVGTGRFFGKSRKTRKSRSGGKPPRPGVPDIPGACG